MPVADRRKARLRRIALAVAMRRRPLRRGVGVHVIHRFDSGGLA